MQNAVWPRSISAVGEGAGIRVSCRRCDAHIGAQFADDTTLTGFRYSIDSAALRFFKS